MQSELNYIPKIAFITNPSSDNHLDYIRLYKDIFNLDQMVYFTANCDRTIRVRITDYLIFIDTYVIIAQPL